MLDAVHFPAAAAGPAPGTGTGLAPAPRTSLSSVAFLEKELTRERFPGKGILYLGLAPGGGEEEQGEEAASWTLPCSPYFPSTLLELGAWNRAPELVTLFL
jgi:hypothetical protein